MALLAAAAFLSWLLAGAPGAFRIALPFALFYSILLALAALALLRIRMIERWFD